MFFVNKKNLFNMHIFNYFSNIDLKETIEIIPLNKYNLKITHATIDYVNLIRSANICALLF